MINAERTIPQQSNLLRAMERYDRNGKYAKQGKWSIAHGGYDLSFEVCFEGVPVIDGVKNAWEGKTHIELCNDHYGHECNAKKLAKFICDKWEDCFI